MITKVKRKQKKNGIQYEKASISYLLFKNISYRMNTNFNFVIFVLKR